MALRDMILDHNHRVFMNMNHFAEKHTWNNMPFTCVTDEDEALKRKNNNVVDVSWDNNSRDVLVYVPVEDFPGRAMPNEHGVFDGRPMRILQVNEDHGMYSILLATFEPKEVGY